MVYLLALLLLSLWMNIQLIKLEAAVSDQTKSVQVAHINICFNTLTPRLPWSPTSSRARDGDTGNKIRPRHDYTISDV